MRLIPTAAAGTAMVALGLLVALPATGSQAPAAMGDVNARDKNGATPLIQAAQ